MVKLNQILNDSDKKTQSELFDVVDVIYNDGRISEAARARHFHRDETDRGQTLYSIGKVILSLKNQELGEYTLGDVLRQLVPSVLAGDNNYFVPPTESEASLLRKLGLYETVSERIKKAQEPIQ